MPIQEQISQKTARYKLAPHITLGNLQGSLVGFKGQSITKIDGEGVVEFIEGISEYLIRDNGVSIEELEENFDIESAQLKNVLEFLVTNGMCVKSDFDFNLTALLAYERAGGQVSVEDILHRIQTGIVEVIARENNGVAKELIANLREFRLNVVLKGESDVKPSIRIAVGTSHLDPLLEEVNDIALEDNIPWLSVVPYDGQTAWVGPFFIPHQSACLHCYNLRKSANFADDVFRSELMKIKPVKSDKQPVYNQPINLVQNGIASNLITEWVALRDYASSAIPGGFTTINLDDRGISFNNHRVYRVPRCQKCSHAADTGFPQVWYHGEVSK
ncbi:cyclodehydratase [Bacillus cereus]|nr:cyclodehydratase [Bacillus cereus]PGU90332.1 cyclodehydratase [Bacillus cereus]